MGRGAEMGGGERAITNDLTSTTSVVSLRYQGENERVLPNRRLIHIHQNFSGVEGGISYSRHAKFAQVPLSRILSITAKILQCTCLCPRSMTPLPTQVAITGSSAPLDPVIATVGSGSECSWQRLREPG